jgi:hypothetical protein
MSSAAARHVLRRPSGRTVLVRRLLKRSQRVKDAGQAQFMSRLIVGLATTLLVSVGLGPAAGIAHAGDFHWCPGDPPPQGVRFDAAGHAGQRVAIYPAWDTSVCHDYIIEGDHVK